MRNVIQTWASSCLKVGKTNLYWVKINSLNEELGTLRSDLLIHVYWNQDATSHAWSVCQHARRSPTWRSWVTRRWKRCSWHSLPRPSATGLLNTSRNFLLSYIGTCTWCLIIFLIYLLFSGKTCWLCTFILKRTHSWDSLKEKYLDSLNFYVSQRKTIPCNWRITRLCKLF